ERGSFRDHPHSPPVPRSVPMPDRFRPRFAGGAGAHEAATSQRRMDRGLVRVMAVATGVSVANNYYAQPLLPAIGKTLHLRPGLAGLIVTSAQVGYAGGLILVVPLGDLVERRRLVVVLCAGTGLALFGLAASPSAPFLLAAA